MIEQLKFDIGDNLYLVFSTERLNGTKNIVLYGHVEGIMIKNKEIVYTFRPTKIMTDKKDNLDKYVSYYWFENKSIDSGIKTNAFTYCVFTTKEKCIKWLKR